MQRVALITGRGNVIGIGNSTAPTLAMTGTAVVMSEVSPVGLANEPTCRAGWIPAGTASKVWSMRSAPRAEPPRPYPAMSAGKPMLPSMADQVLRRQGRIDVLVSNVEQDATRLSRLGCQSLP